MGEKFGSWTPVFSGSSVESFYAKAFFLPHPSLMTVDRRLASEEAEVWKASSFVAVIFSRWLEQKVKFR